VEEREERERQRGNRKSETRRSLSREKTGAIATTIFARPLLPSTPPDDEPESWSCDCCSHVIGPLSSSSLSLSLALALSLEAAPPNEGASAAPCLQLIYATRSMPPQASAVAAFFETSSGDDLNGFASELGEREGFPDAPEALPLPPPFRRVVSGCWVRGSDWGTRERDRESKTLDCGSAGAKRGSLSFHPAARRSHDSISKKKLLSRDSPRRTTPPPPPRPRPGLRASRPARPPFSPRRSSTPCGLPCGPRRPPSPPRRRRRRRREEAAPLEEPPLEEGRERGTGRRLVLRRRRRRRRTTTRSLAARDEGPRSRRQRQQQIHLLLHLLPGERS